MHACRIVSRGAQLGERSTRGTGIGEGRVACSPTDYRLPWSEKASSRTVLKRAAAASARAAVAASMSKRKLGAM